MVKTQFREGGLYALPNEQEFIIFAGEDDSYNFCSPKDGADDSLIDYRLSRDGRIYHRGTRTNWGVDDLLDTGRSATHTKAVGGSV
jgi:hypothetical protein